MRVFSTICEIGTRLPDAQYGKRMPNLTLDLRYLRMKMLAAMPWGTSDELAPGAI